MSPDDFTFLVRLLRRRSGLWLTPAKRDLVERRLAPLMHRFGFRDLDGLVHELRLGRETLARAVAEAVTVNETSFFRDRDVFARFSNVLLPQLLRARESEKRLRIWSAATAAGQEAYSIAMILDAAGLTGWSIDLIATDLSGDAIARAETGRYDEMEVARGLDETALARWFQRDGKDWRVAEHLRRMVDFRTFNLLDSYGWLDDLDIIFCRNVLIYFDPATKASVLERMGETLRPDGLLLLGEAEAPDAMVQAFVELPGGECVYAKRRATVARLAVS